jgi:hypothetical protein
VVGNQLEEITDYQSIENVWLMLAKQKIDGLFESQISRPPGTLVSIICPRSGPVISIILLIYLEYVHQEERVGLFLAKYSLAPRESAGKESLSL